MNDRRLVVSALVMLMMSGWSGAALAAIGDADVDGAKYGDSRADDATWGAVSNAFQSSYELRQTTGLIYSPYGSFDPLSEPMPLGPETLYDSKALTRTGYAVVQAASADMTTVASILEDIGISIADHLPDDAFVIRIPANRDTASILKILNDRDEIRWAGEMPIAWRVAPNVALLAGRLSLNVDLDLIPAADLSDSELSDLEADLESISTQTGPRGICDAHLCQPRGVSAFWIPVLAMDGRILYISEASRITILNSNASAIAGITQAFVDSNNTLNGSGEVIAISDTGLDADHGDFDGRVRGIYNQFGPDNSAADRNSGHGTHVTATLLGDGTGDSGAMGMIPAASFHFYQLEVDSSGILARWGSLYDMFTHAWQNSARIQSNSWGNENLVGEYTADSRSADAFIVDNPRFMVLFPAGELGADGTDTITPPGTAKNVLTIGASTTGSLGSDAVGAVPDFSSLGATLDGRIKPDLVAPGVLICSARAEEAESATGASCSAALHDDGLTPLYMALNGSSMATAVAAGGVAMVRQHLREEGGINEPRSDLIKALLINAATDIGAADIPNAAEGWGQIDVANSISPMQGTTSLDLLYDDSRQLDPGHSFVYTFVVDNAAEFDLTLVWVDAEASSISNQSAVKLVNDLDLTATAPDGTVYHGNVFANGYSATGGSADGLNNVERIKIGSGQSGTWTITVGHAGGITQDFALVMTGLLHEETSSDLTVFAGSLTTSVSNPLQGDTILVEAAWRNQAAKGTGQYSVEIEDLTAGNIIYTSQQNSLAGGATNSFSFPHVFLSTGDHLLELRLDTGDDVVELNDENIGVDNNKIQMTIQITQIGVRLTPLMEDGSYPSNQAELDSAHTQTLDPRTGSLVSYDLVLANEGTETISVGLSVTPVQRIDENGIMQAPRDEWWKLLNESGPWELAPFGDAGDSVRVTLTLEDVDADLTDGAGARYALPGTFVNDLNLYDKNAPTVAHTIRLSTIVERVEGLYTILAGTGDDLGGEPGEFATYSLSIRNTGNGPTQYSVSCSSDDRWTIHIGSSESDSVVLDPLSRLQFLPLTIHVRIPAAVDGQPAAGLTEDVTCVTTSVQDASVTTTEVAVVTVFESHDFSVDLYNSEGDVLGAMALADDRAVLNGDIVVTELLLSNEGNIEMNFEMSVSSALNTWAAQISYDGEDSTDSLTFSVDAGASALVIVEMIVPMNAEMGTRNTLTIRTTLGDGPTMTNGTRFIVQEVAALETSDDGLIRIALGQTGTNEVWVRNAGNVPLILDWTVGSLPEGWVGGFQSIIPAELDMNREALVTIGLELPGNLPIGLLDERVSIILEATTPGEDIVVHTFELAVEVVPSIWIELAPDSNSLSNIDAGSEGRFTITVQNLGNVDTGVTLEIQGLEDWRISIEPSSIDSIVAGGSVDVIVTVSPDDEAQPGLMSFTVLANSTDEGGINVVTDDVLVLEVSRARDSSCSGIGCLLVRLGLPKWTLAVIFLFALAGLGVAMSRMRGSTASSIRPEEELIPTGSALHSGSQIERRAAAMDTGSSGEVLSTSVSDDEISDALVATVPSLSLPPVPPGAMPLPPGGLPDGWTMDQWVAYGHLWYEQNV